MKIVYCFPMYVVEDDHGERVGPVFSSYEAAREWMSSR